MLLGVLVATLFVAGLTYFRFLQAPEHLWPNGSHDRNAHYRLGQTMGLHLRQGQILGWLNDVHSSRVWPPLHTILLGIVLAVGGIDYSLAVLPSLGAWVATCVFAFLLARRLVVRGGNLAGIAAWLFVLASPAHRAYSTDVMLESLGAGLTLAALYFYVRAIQERTAILGCCLGLALTALFLTKYNYWTLVCAGLGLATLVSSRQAIRDVLMSALGRFSWRGWVFAQLRHPLTYLLVPCALLTAAVVIAVDLLKGPLVIQLGSRHIELRTTQNLAHITFVLLVLRLLPWWWKKARPAIVSLAAPLRQVVQWHGYALVLWFLWPQRLGYFLWYVTYSNHGRVGEASALAGNFSYYWDYLTRDYHVSLASLVVALLFAGVALIGCRRLRPGASGVLTVLVVAALLTNYHSANRSRFLHTWIALTWVAGGAGLACLVFGYRSERWSRLRLGLAGSAVVALGFLLLPGILKPGHAEEGGPTWNRPSMLELAASYMPEIAQAQEPTLLSNSAIHMFFEWSFAERYGGRRLADVNLGWTKDPGNPAAFDKWIQSTHSDMVVFVEMTEASPFEQPSPPDHASWMRERLASQKQFIPVRQWVLPGEDGVTLSLWKRQSDVQTAASAR